MPTISDIYRTSVDNNYKVKADGDLAPDEDVFGSVINDWTEIDDPAVEGFAGQNWVESDGLLIPTAPAGANTRSTQRRNITYGDFDMVMHIGNGYYIGPTAEEGAINFWNWIDSNNLVSLDYYFQRNTGIRLNRIYVSKRINGVWTGLYSADLAGQSEMWFRVKRLLTSGPSNNYFYFYTSINGSAFTLQYSAQIRDATHFNESDTLYPLIGCYGGRVGTTYSPEITMYYQYTGDIAAQRFWPDSPEFEFRIPGKEHAFNAGDDCFWNLTGASASESEPGASTVRFKIGYSDTGLQADATWDGAWLTEAQVNTNAAAGNYDDHQYIHVKVQLNSTGADQPGCSDFTINGAAVCGASGLLQMVP